MQLRSTGLQEDYQCRFSQCHLSSLQVGQLYGPGGGGVLEVPEQSQARNPPKKMTPRAGKLPPAPSAPPLSTQESLKASGQGEGCGQCLSFHLEINQLFLPAMRTGEGQLGGGNVLKPPAEESLPATSPNLPTHTLPFSLPLSASLPPGPGVLPRHSGLLL